jgi:hypothetical protein
MKKIVLTIATLLASYGAFAQDTKQDSSKIEFSVEIDPLTFGLNGYGVHVRIKPKNSQHLLLGAGAYAMDFPSVLVD